MWHFVFIVPRADGADAETSVFEASKEFPQTSLSFALEEDVIVLVPANITDDQAEIMLQNDCAVLGSGVVRWFESWMAKEVERGYRRSEQHRREHERSMGAVREVADKLGIKLPK